MKSICINVKKGPEWILTDGFARKVMLPILRMLAGFFPLFPVNGHLFPSFVSLLQPSLQGSSRTASPPRGLTWTMEWMEKGRKAWALLRMLRTVRVTKAFDEEVLRDAGISDLSGYRVDPDLDDDKLLPDFFLD